MTSDIVEQLRAWAEPISSGYEVPRAAVTLYEAADEIEALRSRLAEQDKQLTSYDVLRRAVNESTNECGPNCDDYGHGDDCPALNPSSWLESQQQELETLRSRLADVSGERDLILIRAENAETALGQVEARLAEADAKALRFDLDQLGIALREKEAVELVELRQRLRDWHRVADERSAEIVRLSARLAEAEKEIERLRNGYEGACYCCEPVAVVNIELNRKLAEVEALLTELNQRPRHFEDGVYWLRTYTGDYERIARIVAASSATRLETANNS